MAQVGDGGRVRGGRSDPQHAPLSASEFTFHTAVLSHRGELDRNRLIGLLDASVRIREACRLQEAVFLKNPQISLLRAFLAPLVSLLRWFKMLLGTFLQF